jgi:hypothetical protein
MKQRENGTKAKECNIRKECKIETERKSCIRKMEANGQCRANGSENSSVRGKKGKERQEELKKKQVH